MTKKTPNPTDLTRRNLIAAKRREAALTKRVKSLEHNVVVLWARVDRIFVALAETVERSGR